jgi:hypothetical protein
LQRDNFKSQWEQVQKEYPLVALALFIQEVALDEVTYDDIFESNDMNDAYSLFTGRLRVSRDEIIKRDYCRRDLWRDLGNSQSHQDVGAAFKRHYDCIHDTRRGNTNN